MNETAKVGAFTLGGLMAFGAATMSLANVDFGADSFWSDTSVGHLPVKPL